MTQQFPTFKAAGSAIWSFLRRALVVLAALLVVFLFVHSVLLVVWGKQLENKLAEIRAKGEPVFAADMIPPKVPDSKNAAIVYQQAYKELVSPDIVHGSVVPSIEDPIASYLGDDKSGEQKEALEPKVRILIIQNEKALDLAKKAAAKPACVFPINWQDWPNTSLVHLQWQRRLTKLIVARAIIEAKDGKSDKAINDILLATKVAQASSNDACLISLSVANANLRYTSDGFKRIMDSHSVTTAQAQRVYSELSGISVQDSYKKAVEGERAGFNVILDRVRGDLWGSLKDFGFHGLPDGLFTRVRCRAQSYVLRPFFYKDQLLSLELMEKVERDSSIPFREAVSRDWNNLNTTQPNPIIAKLLSPELADLESNIVAGSLRPTVRTKAKALPVYAFWTRIMMPAITGVVGHNDSTTARLGMAQTAAALEAFRNQNGSYPASIQELDKELRWAIPEDPFSGKPFVYKWHGDSYTLYSIGANMKDDGGKAPPKTDVNAMKGGDIIWRIENLK